MMLTRSVAESQRKHQIRAYCLNIGWTATEQEHQLETGQPENWLEIAAQPFGRILRPEDIAPLVTFCSAKAMMVSGPSRDQKLVLGPYLG